MSRPQRDCSPIGTKLNADGSPNFGYLDLGRWWENVPPGHSLGRGWVRDARFGSGEVIPGVRRKAKA